MSSLDLFIPADDYHSKVSRDSFNDKTPFATLLNIPGMRYTIGSTYPGKRENEEFIFYDWKGLIASIQCQISVDNEGSYWIHHRTEVYSRTFLNGEKVDEPRVLKHLDNISFGLPRNFDENKSCPVLQVRMPQQIRAESHSPDYKGAGESLHFVENNPLNNDLILSSVFRYLEIPYLKQCRLVTKQWNQEAKKFLKLKGSISLDFQKPWKIPKNSMQIFHYRHQRNNWPVKSLIISVPRSREDNRNRKYSQKLLDDFNIFLDLENSFTKLCINTPIDDEVLSFHSILETFGNNLLELEFGRNFQIASYFTCLFNGLQKFTDISKHKYPEFELEMVKRRISSLITSSSKTLKSFSCKGPSSPIYIDELSKVLLPKLTHLELNCSLCASDFRKVCKMEGSFVTLVLKKIVVDDSDLTHFVTALLRKHVKTLVRLQLGLAVEIQPTEFLFPQFPMLRELNFQFTKNVLISWEGCEFSYQTHFPLLRILELRALFHENHSQGQMASFEWERGGSVFTSFFPDRRGVICKTVTKITVPSIKNDMLISGEEFRRYNLRIFRIPEMFPEVQTQARQGLGLEQTDYGNSDTEELLEAHRHFFDGDGSDFGFPFRRRRNSESDDDDNDGNQGPSSLYCPEVDDSPSRLAEPADGDNADMFCSDDDPLTPLQEDDDDTMEIHPQDEERSEDDTAFSSAEENDF